MHGEDIPKPAPAVPGVSRLAWMLLMQPLRLHNLFKRWALKEDPPLANLHERATGGDPIVNTVLNRFALIRSVYTPAATASILGLLACLGIPIHWTSAATTAAFFLGTGILAGNRTGIAFGAISGMIGCFAFGIAAGVAGDAIFGLPSGVALGISLGVMVGLGWGASICVSDSTPIDPWFAFITSLGVGVASAAIAAIVAVENRLDSAKGAGFASLISCFISFLRLPFWPFEALAATVLSLLARRFPDRISTLARFLPFRLHDLIYLPLPGLRSFLLVTAETNPDLARVLVAEAAIYPAQSAITSRTSAELQALDLERAARGRLFARAAALDFTFLPAESTIDNDSPIRIFQSAARDLDAGKDDPRQRRLAIERSRKTIEGFLYQSASKRKPSPLETRLRPTARLWLDVIQDEYQRLEVEEIANPQVPRAFIAGPPLSPDRIEDAPLFKGRNDIGKIISHDLDPHRRGILIVVGQRRMGKSSLRNWLPRLLGTGTIVLAADFQYLSGHPHREHPHRWLVDLILQHFPGVPPPPGSNRWGESFEWFQQIDKSDIIMADNKVLLVIDEVERVEDGIRAGWCSTDFLDFLRAAGDSLRRIRILLLTAHPLHRLGRHWIDRLISATTRSLTYLDASSAEELVRTPVPDFPDIYPDGGVARILRETHCHPFLVQKTCDELCKFLNAHGGRRKATSDELDAVIDAVAEEKLFDELWAQCTDDEKCALQKLASADTPLRADTAMRALAREGITVLDAEQAAIAVPLFAAWIRLTRGRLDT